MFFELYLNKFDCERKIQDNKRRCSWNCSQIALRLCRFSVIRASARVLWVILEKTWVLIKNANTMYYGHWTYSWCFIFCHLSFWSTNYHFCFRMLTFIRVLQYSSFHSWNVFVPPCFHSTEPSHQHIGFLQLLSSTHHDLKMFQ